MKGAMEIDFDKKMTSMSCTFFCQFVFAAVWCILAGIFAFTDPDELVTNTSFGCCHALDNHEPVYCTEKNAQDKGTFNVT